MPAAVKWRILRFVAAIQQPSSFSRSEAWSAIPLFIEPLKTFREGPLPKQNGKRKAFCQKVGFQPKSLKSPGKSGDWRKVAATFKGPFGEPIRVTGSVGKANPFRWSTKYTDDETDLVYYGARFYNPSTGRWLNRDPLGEKGGPNLYGFVHNNPISLFDSLGLEQGIQPWPPPIPPSMPYLPPPQLPPPPDASKIEGFALCQRDINETSILDKCWNSCGGLHQFLQYYDGEKRWGYGFSSAGVKPEVIFKPNRCSTCVPGEGVLQHGIGAGQGKKAKDASVDEIKDCIKNKPARRGYLFMVYDCRDWVKEAAKQCGLDCK